MDSRHSGVTSSWPAASSELVVNCSLLKHEHGLAVVQVLVILQPFFEQGILLLTSSEQAWK